jgi:hypothetical protein
MDPGADLDADPDPIFVINLQEANKKLIFFITFFCLLLVESTYIYISLKKIKSLKEVTKK